MNNPEIISELQSIRAIASMLQDKAAKLEARLEGGVSTQPKRSRKGLNVDQRTAVKDRFRNRILKNNSHE